MLRCHSVFYSLRPYSPFCFRSHFQTALSSCTSFIHYAHLVCTFFLFVFFPPPSSVCVWGNYRSHASPKRYRTVPGCSSGGSQFPEHLMLLRTSPAVMSNLHFCLNTQWDKKKRKTAMPDDERIMWQSLTHTENSPHPTLKPSRHSSPMHYRSVVTQLPYGFYTEWHDETTEWLIFVTMRCIIGCQMQFPCVISNCPILGEWINLNQTSNTASVSNLFAFSFAA